MSKYVYFFGQGKTEGKASMKDVLGGKGANLAEMTNLGIPVPAGFTITTTSCQHYYENNKSWPKTLNKEIDTNLKKLEASMGAKFGDPANPLLVSVRSGAAASMPGMMDTILNLGLNKKVVEAMAAKTDNPRFAWDSFRRFIQMFGNVVANVPHEDFEEILEAKKKQVNAANDTGLSTEDLQDVVDKYLAVYEKITGSLFPTDPREQLTKSINAVFLSWNNDRANTYRKLNNISGLIGTAVNIQAMVFGNMGANSGTGVCFSRNPSTGENKFYGEYLMDAQGEDVVAGIRTPQPIKTLANKNKKIYEELVKYKDKLEKHYRDMQDIEFTIQDGSLYILQTRNGKRTAAAALKIAVDMVKEKLISQKEAILRIDPNQLDQMLHPSFDVNSEKQALQIAKGLPASPGAATGQIVFNAEDAEAWTQKGAKVILTRIETSPEDIVGMNAAVGILTARGGMTSHAAVVARGMGTCCVAGVKELDIDYTTKKLTVNGTTLKEGDYISINGTSGNVYSGKINTTEAKLTGNFLKLMKWADQARTLGIRANADTPKDARKAVEFGAEGIGLCRTEHMFFEEDRIASVRKMILSDTTEQREKALAELLPLQRTDFEGLFLAMKGRPVTIRLIDPPLHEFLPHEKDTQVATAKQLKISLPKLKEKIEDLRELNPMLGHRGCRLSISYPEIIRMQTRAILEAAINVKKKGVKAKPEIMVPLVGYLKEYEFCKNVIKETATQVFAEKKSKINFLIGTMIEVPRAALIADEIAKTAQFFSFGTNDLTQMTCGLSRDDAGRFLSEYVDKQIIEQNPFETLDQEGVGQLVTMGINKGRQTKKDLKIGICGEHGGNPESIHFCHGAGMNYVSCSPFRVPIARLAAAQAALK